MLKGVVLAGGKSRRFGEDKALLEYQGKTLLERAVLLLKSVSLDPVVVSSKGRSYPFLDCPVIGDVYPEKGPLGGVYTALKFLKSPVIVLTCDMPALNKDVLVTLIERYKETKSLITFYQSSEDGVQPFPGIYCHSLFSVMSKRLEKGELSMHGLIESLSHVTPILLESEQAVQAFMNINSQGNWVKYQNTMSR